MRTIVCTALVLSAFLLFLGGDAGASRQTMRYMAFCTDGDGDLSGWLTSRNEAYLAGREHERMNRGHRWEVLVEGTETPRRDEGCSLVSPGKREGTVRVENVCSACMIFRVARKAGDGTAREKDITFQANASRFFRTMQGAQFSILREMRCPE
jgi:hypothetical protein